MTTHHAVADWFLDLDSNYQAKFFAKVFDRITPHDLDYLVDAIKGNAEAISFFSALAGVVPPFMVTAKAHTYVADRRTCCSSHEGGPHEVICLNATTWTNGKDFLKGKDPTKRTCCDSSLNRFHKASCPNFLKEPENKADYVAEKNLGVCGKCWTFRNYNMGRECGKCS